MSEETKYAELKRLSGNFLTRTKAFKGVCKWAFNVCDGNNTGFINKTELYAGMLLVHLTCAKYAGPAACYPPSRHEVERLFEAADDDESGSLDQEEFNSVMIILCSNITSRILTYYAILIIAVPYLATWALDLINWFGTDEAILKFDATFDTYAPEPLRAVVDLVPDSLWASLPESMISLAFFFFVIPKLMDMIAEVSFQAADAAVVLKEENKDEKVE